MGSDDDFDPQAKQWQYELSNMQSVLETWSVPPDRHYRKLREDMQVMQINVAMALTDMKTMDENNHARLADEYNTLALNVARVGMIEDEQTQP